MICHRASEALFIISAFGYEKRERERDKTQEVVPMYPAMDLSGMPGGGFQRSEPLITLVSWSEMDCNAPTAGFLGLLWYFVVFPLLSPE